jgi:cytoskeletal protein RodZ
MTEPYKSKMVEESYSRSLVRFMILTAWISFVISTWLTVLWWNNLFYFSFFWLALIVILAEMLASVKK